MRETVTPKNPNSETQRIQRVIIGTVGKAYARMKAITDHSFEGYTNGAQCMNRFRKLNANRLRAHIASELAKGTDMSSIYDLNKAGLALNNYIMSEGSLPLVKTSLDYRRGLITQIPYDTENLPTYQDVANSLGLKRGDQLTVIILDGDFNTGKGFIFQYARIILSPYVNGSSAAFNTPFITITGGKAYLNAPNPRNQGVEKLTFGVSPDDTLLMTLSNNNVPFAGCIIASRKVNNDWLRSNSELVMDSSNSLAAGFEVSLYDAIHEENTISLENNTLYLNNATD